MNNFDPCSCWDINLHPRVDTWEQCELWYLHAKVPFTFIRLGNKYLLNGYYVSDPCLDGEDLRMNQVKDTFMNFTSLTVWGRGNGSSSCRVPVPAVTVLRTSAAAPGSVCACACVCERALATEKKAVFIPYDIWARFRRISIKSPGGRARVF